MSYFNDGDVVLPFIVLEELDRFKSKMDSRGSCSRAFIRLLDGYREKGDLSRGVLLNENSEYKMSVRILPVSTMKKSNLDLDIADNYILEVAKDYKKKEDNEVILVTKDINLRIKCSSLKIESLDFNPIKFAENKDKIYTGHKEIEVTSNFIDNLYKTGEGYLEEEVDKELYPNQFLTVRSNQDSSKSCLVRYCNSSIAPIDKKLSKNSIWGLKARNREQTLALDLLLDPEIKLVSLIGQAGCGKTILALAAGLQQVLPHNKEGEYKKLIVSRPIQPMGREIGFLPGTMEEKMSPWIAPIKDNLEYLMGGDRDYFERYLDEGTIQIEVMTYIRGRSIAQAFIIIDEVQNITAHELKTVLTRVGEGTKIVLTGDIEQIDNQLVDEVSNGLTYAVEKFKDYSIAGHITLKKGERSELATLAAKIL